MLPFSCTGQAKSKTARSLLSGALIRKQGTGELAQIIYGDMNSKGRRILEIEASLLRLVK